MKKIKAFTLIEVMISIFIFTTSMLGYMAFHAHSMAMLFENESAQFAHSLAFDLVDEINAMSYDSFKNFSKIAIALLHKRIPPSPHRFSARISKLDHSPSVKMMVISL